MLSFLLECSEQTWQIVTEAAPWLLVGFLLAGAIHILVPVSSFSHHFGRRGWVGVVKASLLGIPLPLCSCSVIPVAFSIRKQGATRGAFVSFLVSTPETGVDSIAISYALLGPFLAVARPVAALITAITAGLLVDYASPPSTSGDENGAKNGNDSCGCAVPGENGNTTTETRKLSAALRYSFVEMFVDLGPWLLAGFVLAGVFSALIPPGALGQYVGQGVGTMLLMLLAGLPLYVCATSSTPIAAALIAAGLSPGAALVFLLVGPATNIATMLVVIRDLGKCGLAIYLLTISCVAVGAGLVTDLVWSTVPRYVDKSALNTESTTSVIAGVSAVILTLLILNGLRIRLGVGSPLSVSKTPSSAQ